MKDTQSVQIQGVHFAQVRLKDIEERTDLMQFRERLQEHHVAELVGILKQDRELDPVTLWEDPETGATVLVDGHHRLAAYRRAEWSKPIPSQVHHCDRKAARLLAMGENGKARLQFTTTERRNAAWALACDGSTDQWFYSRAEVASAAGRKRQTRFAYCPSKPADRAKRGRHCNLMWA
ncbi:MAG: ParB N-terminal domain-containing protein [Tateyamaria sp.]|uniref:ParB N-terminal domain-containing protein n=1 Tax=Alphaproteobacteria TaxID=28211 RepID=UPI003287A39E